MKLVTALLAASALGGATIANATDLQVTHW
jgi:hypothetical protein